MRAYVFLLALVPVAVALTGCSSSAPQGKLGDQNEALKAAAAEPGAVKTATGLVFKELTPGTGPVPHVSSTVRVNYKGTLTDGTEFDSSYKRNEPASFPLGQVIPCWTEGVQMMKAGGKAKLTCPSAIAYGEAGSPPVIPPGATLIFEIELLSVSGA